MQNMLQCTKEIAEHADGVKFSDADQLIWINAIPAGSATSGLTYAGGYAVP
jgi:hypothetical protein